MTQTKRCAVCGEVKPITSFGKRSRNKDGLDNRCRDCALKSEQLRGRWFDEYKSSCKCAICGESDPVCLDFHHKNPTAKDKSMTNYRFYNKERVIEELKKCVCLCSNCHKKFHAHGWEIRGDKICLPISGKAVPTTK